MHFKNFTSIFILCVLPIFCAASDFQDLYVKAKSNIIVVDADGSLCAGFYINENSILTAAHCVPYLFFTYIYTPEEPVKYENAQVIAKDSKNDLALLRVSTKAGKGLKLRDRNKELKVLEEIYTIGHPGLQQPSPLLANENLLAANTGTNGVISNINNETLKLALTSDHGNSGGPILDHENQVISLVSRGNYQYTLVPSLGVITKFEEENRLATNPLDWKSSDHGFDLYFWLATHSYLKKINKSRRLDFIEFDFDYRNRFRFGLGANGSTSLEMGSINLGYKFSIAEASHDLAFLVLGLEHVSYLLNPNKLESENYDFRKGDGAYFLINTGRSGLALKLSVLGFSTGTETVLALGFFL